MKCDRCGGHTEILKGQTWHYVEFGLDNVYLRNLEIRRCTACDAKALRLPCINDLHARWRGVACGIEERGEPLVVLISAGKPHAHSYHATEQLAT